jgi:hypothetical protein
MTALLLALALQDNDMIERKLQAVKIDADFRETPIKEVADFIRDVVGINVLLDREVDGNAAVSFQAKAVSAKTVLNLVCAANGWGIKISEGILFITTKEKAQGDVHLEIYEVTDITMPIKNYPGGEVQFGDTIEIIPPPPEEPSPDLGDFLAEMIRTFTGNQAWESDRTSIVYQNGLLIVKQTNLTYS